MQLTSKIKKLLGKDSYVPATAEQIYKQLKEPQLPKTQLEKALEVLEAEGHIQIVNKKFILAQKSANVFQGRFDANTKGYGFVINPGSDIYVRSDKVGGALNGDIVEVSVIKKAGGRRLSGKIVKILERSKTSIIGRVEIQDSSKWLIPSDKRLHNRFLINKPAEVKDGQMIVAEITKYPPKGLVSLTEILGDEGSLDVEIEVIIREHELSTKWSRKAVEQENKLPAKVDSIDLKDRKDYRDDYVVTIDGLDAKDFDDAVSLSKKGNKYHLTVHIADVSAYVPEGSPLDEEALLRGNSTYLPDRVIPMFPFKLSNNLASLNPDVDRLVLSVESIINENGDVESFKINKGVIKSKARLTYEEVDTALESGNFKNDEQKTLLSSLLELQKKLEKQRLENGSLVFETIEPKILFDEENNPIDLVMRERSDATAIIEEVMILTNIIVAKYMSKRKYPIVYRFHEEPAEDALSEIEGLLRAFNYPVQDLKNVEHKTYQNLIKFAHNRKDKLLINSVIIRSMQKAKYSTTKKSHFGLALKHYCHFTSPIRRYSDLVVHRQIKRMLANDFDFNKTEVTGKYQEVAENISFTETESIAAERESKDLMIASFMKDKVGEEYEAIVTGVTSFGLFVQIPNSAEGLVHITSLRDDYYIFEPERYSIRGRRTKKVYRLGQKIKVQLINVIIGERQLDFEII